MLIATPRITGAWVRSDSSACRWRSPQFHTRTQGEIDAASLASDRIGKFSEEVVPCRPIASTVSFVVRPSLPRAWLQCPRSPPIPLRPQPVSKKSSSPRRSAQRICRRRRLRSALSQTELDRAHVNDIAGLQTLVPDLTVEQHGDSGGVHVYLRGIGSTNHTELGDPAVAFHIDGVYSPRPQGATVLMYDRRERRSAARSARHALRPQLDRGSRQCRHLDAGAEEVRRVCSVGRRLQSHRYPRHGEPAPSETFGLRAAVATENRDGFVDFQPRSAAKIGVANTAQWIRRRCV